MSFEEQMIKFQIMYNMPRPSIPTTAAVEDNRTENFREILCDEITEFDDVPAKDGKGDIDHLTALADLYGDIIIYCWSEMLRYGIDPVRVLDIIMQSNFSKLDEKGNPIFDKRNKLMKGPNYWKPEPKIKEMLLASRGGQ